MTAQLVSIVLPVVPDDLRKANDDKPTSFQKCPMLSSHLFSDLPHLSLKFSPPTLFLASTLCIDLIWSRYDMLLGLSMRDVHGSSGDRRLLIMVL